MTGKESCGGSCPICPVSFGFALGITCALAMIIRILWEMHYGPMPALPYHLPVPASFKDGAIFTLLSFVKGFVFGFVLIWFYDTIISKCKKTGYCRYCGKEESKKEGEESAK